MKKKLLLLNKNAWLLLLLATPSLYAQWTDGLWTGKQANNWCDSYNGINFSTGSPVLFPGPQLFALEGSSAISKTNGDLLFYAGQNKVWNRNNQVMPNGYNLTGGGDSSTQSGVFVQKPGDANIYYLFNVNTSDVVTGLLYSEIDLSLAAGLGDVTANKNIMLDALVGVEKITAVHHADGQGVWVITHRTGSADFVAYLVTATGISTTAVVSTVGTVYAGIDPNDPYITGNDGGVGQLKVSPDGSKLAAAILDGPHRGVQLFDFNNQTGEVSNPRYLSGNTGFVYGLEFSPNSRFLYVSNPQSGWTFGGSVLQYDVTLATETDINNSNTALVTLPSGGAYGPNGMQLAPNGRIYIKDVAGEVINAISYPNNQGTAAGFTAGAINLGSSIGTPAFIQSYFESGILSEEGCPGVVAFSLLRIPDATSIAWDFGDPASGAANTSAIAQHTYSTGGTYTVTALITSNGATQTATTTITVSSPAGSITTPDALSGCDDTTGSALFNLISQSPVILGNLDPALYAVGYFTTPQDAVAGTNAIAAPNAFTSAGQIIYVAVTNSNNTCNSYTQFNLVVNPLPIVPQLPNLQTCDTGTPDGFAVFDLTQQTAALLAGQPEGSFVNYYDAQAVFSPLLSPQTYTNTTNPQTIYATVTNNATGCYSVATFTIQVTPALQLPQVANLQACDTGTPDGFTTFDLTQQNTALLAGLPTATVTYYTSQEDAQGGVNGIAVPNSFVNTANPQTVYATVTNTASGCYSIATFMVQVTPLPVAPPVAGLQSCNTGTQDGVATFNLTVYNDILLQGQPGYTVNYFTAIADAQANSSAIAAPNAFTNTTNPQTIYTRISSGDCFAITSFNVTVLQTPQIGGPLTVTGCPPFNLTTAVTGTGLAFTYYATAADADAQTNAITNPESYTLTGNSNTLYVHAQSTEGCGAVAEIDVVTGDCQIQRGISPNNDGLNDAFDLSYFDVQKLSVFNRYGKEVYARSHYTNEWYGQQDNGNDLPTGTYFYVIQLESGSSKTGWIYVNRQVN